MSKYGIPYMGSKSKICASLALNFPKADHFYDLFGGGFSMSHYMLKNKSARYKQFHYNEIKADVTTLVTKAINGDYNYNVFQPEWISREKFFKNLDDPYIRCLWSFGNNQKGYLFGSDIEPYQRSMHQAVVFDEFDSLASEVLRFDKWPLKISKIKQRRIYLRQLIEHYRKTKIPKILYQFLNEKQLEQLQQLKQLQQLERLEQLQQLQRLKQLLQLQQLERLQQLEQLQQLQRLDITALDYRKVEIEKNSIVYCDIPYKGTADYGAFSHTDFFDWASSRDFPVFISEYNIDDNRFQKVYQVSKRSMLSPDKSVGDKTEKLYWNGVSITGEKAIKHEL